MASKGYARFNDDDEEGWGDNDAVEAPTTSPAVLQESPIKEDPAVTAPAELQGLDLNLNENNADEGAHPETAGDMQQGEDGGGPAGDGGDRGDDDDLETQTRSSRWTYAAFYQWIMSNAVMLYSSQLLSAWGDRMWSFTVALYLVEIEEQSLRLTAIYGLCISGSSLVLGAAIGKWVDKTPRLRAARTSLIIQNSSVLINACLLCTVLTLKTDILKVWGGGLYIICQLLIILLGTLASLASLAEKICIQKDWVVVVAGNDKDILAVLNANMRRIDLLSNILAPIAVGAIMTASMLVGGIFVAAWNGVSMVIEYWNLWRVYKNVPALAFKGGVDCTDEPRPDEEVTGQYAELSERGIEAQSESNTPTRNTDESSSHEPDDQITTATKNDDKERGFTEIPVAMKEEDGEREFTEIPVNTPTPSASASSQPATPVTTATKGDRGCCGGLTAKLREMFEGWKVYKSYEEFWAGLGMAFLYMTVLGFDSITIGYGYSQGMPEYAMGILQALGSITVSMSVSVTVLGFQALTIGYSYCQGMPEYTMGILQALGSIIGILGTLLYPIMRRRIGLERTGLYSIWIEIAFLMLCIGSLWAPGSPLIYDYGNSTIDASESKSPLTMTTPFSQMGAIVTPTGSWSTTQAPSASRVQCKYTGSEEQQTSLMSAGILFAGIVLSRIGLWMYDLVVTQLVQENVVETQRGVFNGVQRALECLFDMFHFILIIILPCPETFGYLVIASVVFIIFGAFCYMVYSYKRRGHLLHMEKITPCLTNGHA